MTIITNGERAARRLRIRTTNRAERTTRREPRPALRRQGTRSSVIAAALSEV